MLGRCVQAKCTCVLGGKGVSNISNIDTFYILTLHNNMVHKDYNVYLEM